MTNNKVFRLGVLIYPICGFFDVSLTPVVQSNLQPWQEALLGPVMGLVGAACLWALYRYLRWILKLLRQVASGR